MFGTDTIFDDISSYVGFVFFFIFADIIWIYVHENVCERLIISHDA